MQEIAQTLMNGATSADSRQRSPAAAAFVRESLMRQDPEGYARSCECARRREASRAVERIVAPTLLVTGDEDTVAPPQAVRAMAERLTGMSKDGVRVVVLNKLRPLDADSSGPRTARASCATFLAAQR